MSVYTKPTISGYNANPPPNDGSQVSTNEITWDKHKDKLGDPLRAYADAINNAVESGFNKRIFHGVLSVSGNYNVTAADVGRLLVLSNNINVFLPSAGDVGAGYCVVMRNTDQTAQVLPSGAETINGTSILAMQPYRFAILVSDGSDWQALASPVKAHFLRQNASPITLTGVGVTTITSVSITGLLQGDIIHVSAECGVDKGATADDTFIAIQKTAGTAVIAFPATSNEPSAQFPNHPATKSWVGRVSSVGRVSTAGDITLSLTGASFGSNGAVSGNSGRIGVLVEYNAGAGDG